MMYGKVVVVGATGGHGLFDFHDPPRRLTHSSKKRRAGED
jgi:hypothetical protein